MTPEGKARLRLDEGESLTAYPDPDSPLGLVLRKAGILPVHYKTYAGWRAYSGAPWTCGVGCTGPDITSDTVWTQAQSDAALDERIASTEQRLIHDRPWVASLHPVLQDVLVNIAFNVGVVGLERWPTTLGHFQAGNLQAAHDDLLSEGRWDDQVGDRAKRLAAATLNLRW